MLSCAHRVAVRSSLASELTVRRLILPATLLASAACDGPPARLVAGVADTVIVNDRRPVRLPVQVLDSKSRVLPDTGVRFELTSGGPIALSNTGVVTCAQSGDARVGASLGKLATQLIVRCRPVRDVHALRMVNLVVGGPPQDLPFEAIGVDGQPVTLLTGQVTIRDGTIAAIDGLRIRALAMGSTSITMRVGNRVAYSSVHTYAPATSPEGLLPGQRVAVPVRLASGEMKTWQLAASPESYFLTMLPDADEESMPRFAVVGAACARGLGPHSFFCLAKTDASVIVYHPQDVDPKQRLTGTLAVWRQGWR